MPVNTTIEYVVDSKAVHPTFLFVIDICNFEEELDALKEALAQNVMLLPEEAYVGLISFGKNVLPPSCRRVPLSS